MNPQDEALSVTQADIDAVAAFHKKSFELFFSGEEPTSDGAYNLLCQAFARHRLSHSTPGDAEVRKAVNELHAILNLETREVHVGYEDDMTSKAYVYADYVSAEDAFALVRRAISLLATPSGRAQAWLPIETAPRDGTEIVAAIKVRHTKGGMWWERHVIAADEETGELHPDYDHGWTFDDYELWMSLADLPDLPAAPPAQDQTKGGEA